MLNDDLLGLKENDDQNNEDQKDTAQAQPPTADVEDQIDSEGLRIITPKIGTNILPASWTFWFLHRGPGQKISNYLEATKQVGSFDTVEEFWDLYSHFRRIDKLPFTSEYQLFRKGVKPMWEDPINAQGGKWVVRFKRPKERRKEEVGGSTTTPIGIVPTESPQAIAANRALGHKLAQARYRAALTWEKLILSIIGNTLGEEEEGEGEDNYAEEPFTLDLPHDEITGAVVSVRRDEDIFSVWNRSGNDQEVINKIKIALQRNLRLPDEVTLEYKVHSESIKEGAEKQATYDQYRQQQQLQQLQSTSTTQPIHQNKNGHHYHHHSTSNNYQSHNGHYHNKPGHYHSAFHGPIGKSETGQSSTSTDM